MRALQAAGRPATPGEQQVLARWSGWGSLPEVFERRPGFEDVHDGLRELLDERAWREASVNTLNAHYTDVGLVEAIWDAVGDLGVTSGTVLEPGCGIGTFIGRAPDGVDMVGVELDSTTAAISGLLYPHATIRNEGFERTNLAEGTFHAAIGNVPFGKIRFVDSRHNPRGYNIHDAFITKALNLVAPGGTVALITSRYSLDGAGKNQDARREWATKADLIGAVRLPARAHQRAAGTDVITDVLLLRRRDPASMERGDDERDLTWVDTVPVEFGDGPAVEVNAYFVAHPENVLGEQRLTRGLYRDDEYTVVGDADAAPALRAALTRVVEQATARGLADGGQAARAAIAVQRAAAEPGADQWQDAGDRPEGHIAEGSTVFARTVTHTATGQLLARPRHEQTTFTQVEQGFARPLYLPTTQQGEIRHLIGLRDTTQALLDAEAASTTDTPLIAQLRQNLNDRYAVYAASYGPLNRFSWGTQTRTDRTTKERSISRVRQNPPAVSRFRTDPSSALVWALEDYDPATGLAHTSDIMRRRVVAERVPPTRADTPADALAIVQDQYGRPDLPAIARLLGVPEPAARQMLGTLVFDEPGTGRLVARAEYLSGDVRVKLATARAAAAEDPRYNVNVDELIEVIPEDLGPGDIHARLGATWIAPDDVREFVRELTEDLRADVTKVHHEWKVTGTKKGGSSAASTTWGTGRRDAFDLVESLLNGRAISVTDEIDTPEGGTRRVRNATETIAAQAKADEIKDRFATWVWEDPDRADRLTRLYNDRFNNLALRSYDDAQLLLPGLTAAWTMRPHQIAAIARIVGEPAALLAHEVGAGKTAEMVAGAMELRRLGLARKPAIVVPNHMLEQFSREFLELYPQARILAAGSADLSGDRRRLFAARAATGDWDAVILTQGAFKAIPMSVETQERYLRRHLDEVQAMVEQEAALGERRSPTFKQLQRLLKNEQSKFDARIEKLRQDRGGVTWEQTGIDYLFLDEAHHFKNLALPTGDASMAVEGSDRAADLDMKLHHLRERSTSGRVVTFATATPISNSMGEMYVMIRYLRPDLLQAAGLDTFDAWIATFAEKETRTEMSVDGASFKQKTRFAKFTNAPELIRLFRTFADVKTAEDLGLDTPEILGTPDDTGSTENVVAEASPELRDYIAQLGERAQSVSTGAVDPTVDNMLKISSDGRKAALDMRLVGRRSDGGKIDRAADRIAAIHHQNADRVYKVRKGADQDSDIPGALQLVFCDLGTPTGAGWNVYDELKQQLAARGVPEERIRYVHEARNDQEKAELFAAARAGKVAVLMGSTQMMGVGTNVQNRAIALHHLDAPWRPADVQQRDGRLIRQGNQNPQVQVIRYITEGSFDGFMWGVLHRKGQFIAQAMSGDLTEREFEDIGDSELSAAQAMALGSGNPLLLEKAEVDADLQRLLRLEQGHSTEQRTYRSGILLNDAEAAAATQLAQQLRQAISARTPVDGDNFRLTVAGRQHTKRSEAADALRAHLGKLLDDHRWGIGEQVEIGRYGGHVLAAQTRTRSDMTKAFSIGFRDIPQSFTSFGAADLATANIILRLSNRLNDLEGYLDAAQASAERARTAAQRARDNIGALFPHAERLASIKQRATLLAALLAAQEDQSEDGLITNQRLTAAYEKAREDDRRLAAAAQPLARQPRQRTAPRRPQRSDAPTLPPATSSATDTVPPVTDPAEAAATGTSLDDVGSAASTQAVSQAPPTAQTDGDVPAPRDPAPRSPDPAARAGEVGPAPSVPAGEQQTLDLSPGPQPATGLAAFTAVEQAAIAHAVQDWAPNYYGGPLELGPDSAVRYVTEGHLRDLVTAHGYNAVHDGVQDYLTAHPDLLDRRVTQEERSAREQARTTEATKLLTQAQDAVRTGDPEGALELVDHAEIAAPRWRTYDRIRDRIREIAARPPQTAATPGPDTAVPNTAASVPELATPTRGAGTDDPPSPTAEDTPTPTQDLQDVPLFPPATGDPGPVADSSTVKDENQDATDDALTSQPSPEHAPTAAEPTAAGPDDLGDEVTVVAEPTALIETPPQQEGALVTTPTTAAAPPGDTPNPGMIVIEHTRDGSLVFGTTRDDTQAQQALHATKWRWSPNIGPDGAWYLTRTMNRDTRAARVRELETRLRDLGRPVTRQNDDAWRTAPEDAEAPVLASTTAQEPADPAAPSHVESSLQLPVQDDVTQPAPAPADPGAPEPQAVTQTPPTGQEQQTDDVAERGQEPRRQTSGAPAEGSLSEGQDADPVSSMEAGTSDGPDHQVAEIQASAPEGERGPKPAPVHLDEEPNSEQLGFDLRSLDGPHEEPAPQAYEPAPDTQEFPDLIEAAAALTSDPSVQEPPVQTTRAGDVEPSLEAVPAGAEGCWGRSMTPPELQAARERMEAETPAPAVRMTSEQIAAAREWMAANPTAPAVPLAGMSAQELHEQLLLRMGLAADDLRKLRAGLGAVREDLDRVLYARPYGPGRVSPAVRAFDTGMDYLGAAYQAVAVGVREAVIIGAREIAGPEWEQISRVWQQMRQTWVTARDGARRGGAVALEPWGTQLRTTTARAARSIADLAERWVTRLQTTGQDGTWPQRAAQVLATVAGQVAAHLQPSAAVSSEPRYTTTPIVNGNDLLTARQHEAASPSTAAAPRARPDAEVPDPRVAAAIHLAAAPGGRSRPGLNGTGTRGIPGGAWEASIADLAALQDKMAARFDALDRRLEAATARRTPGQSPAVAGDAPRPVVVAGLNRREPHL